MNLKDGILKLERLREKVANPREFYRRHIDGWKDLARDTAVDILTANRPPDVTAEEWEFTVHHVAEKVGASLISLEAVGVAIYLEKNSERTLEDALFGAVTGDLTLAQIAEYVAAGRAGDPLGKADFNEQDARRTDEQVALNILQAIQKGDVSAEREPAIREFLAARFGEAVEALLPAIRAAWGEVFAVRAAADWRAWWRLG